MIYAVAERNIEIPEEAEEARVRRLP